MPHFYSETSVRTGHPVDVWRMDATKAYLRHYSNLLTLSFFAQTGTRSERADAEKEIIICHRKLKFWQAHPNYDADLALKGVEKLKSDWSGSKLAPNT